MMNSLRQKRVTDRGKYEAGSLSDTTQLPISSGSGRGVGGALDGEDDGVTRRPYKGEKTVKDPKA
jgi:hypothetical protein